MRPDYVILILLTLAVGIFVALYLVRRASRTDDKQQTKEAKDLDVHDEIVILNRVVKNIMLDIRLFQAYNDRHKMSYLILFTMAYILDRKMTQSTMLENIHLLRRFNIAPSARNQDLCDIILTSVPEPDRGLISVLIEKQLARCAVLHGREYENMMINIVLKLGRIERDMTDVK